MRRAKAGREPPPWRVNRRWRGWVTRQAIVYGLGISFGLSAQDANANAWPPAPGADMTQPANWPNDPGYPTQWNLWSWLPAQTSGTPAYLDADRALGASGIHVDVGWTHTIGRPDVIIAVVDSGIEWEEPDLANKAYLNAGELTGALKPKGPGGVACGGTGNLAGYDCNGDGVFSVADYLDDPRISPAVMAPSCPGGMTIQGDVNGNCILDPEDFIQSPVFSDGIDDDANGYIDDIAGWDFFRNDNDPYDDTRSGHGTTGLGTRARKRTTAIGTAGACPALPAS